LSPTAATAVKTDAKTDAIDAEAEPMESRSGVRQTSGRVRSLAGPTPGSPVTPDYIGPLSFTGTIQTVTVDVNGDFIVDHEAEIRVAMAHK
jgi:hypothetical protein